MLNSKYPQVGGSSGGGGGRAGFVNRLIGAIFASLVCHSTFSRCVTAAQKPGPDIGSPEGPVDQLAREWRWAQRGLMVATNRIRAL